MAALLCQSSPKHHAALSGCLEHPAACHHRGELAGMRGRRRARRDPTDQSPAKGPPRPSRAALSVKSVP